MTEDGYRVIDTEGLKGMLDSGIEIAICDARNPEEFQEVHIKNAQSLPEKKFEESVHLLPSDKLGFIVFYCNDKVLLRMILSNNKNTKKYDNN